MAYEPQEANHLAPDLGAEGYPAAHKAAQERIVAEALGAERETSEAKAG